MGRKTTRWPSSAKQFWRVVVTSSCSYNFIRLRSHTVRKRQSNTFLRNLIEYFLVAIRPGAHPSSLKPLLDAKFTEVRCDYTRDDSVVSNIILAYEEALVTEEQAASSKEWGEHPPPEWDHIFHTASHLGHLTFSTHAKNSDHVYRKVA